VQTRSLFALLIFAVSLWVFPMTAMAQDNDVDADIAILQAKAQGALELAGSNIISQEQAQAGVDLWVAHATELAGEKVTQDELLAFSHTAAKSWTARIFGIFSFANAGLAVCAIAFVVFFLWFFGGYLTEIPIGVWKFLLISSALAGMFGASQAPETYAQFVALGGGVLWIAASAWIYFETVGEEGAAVRLYILHLVGVFVALALVYNSVFIASILAVPAFFVLMGLTVGSLPGLIGFGYDYEHIGSRVTYAAMLVLTVFVGGRIGLLHTSWFELFEPATLWLGGLVSFGGLYSLSLKKVSRDGMYPLYNFVAIVFMVSAMFVGYAWGIPELQESGGTFLLLFLATKFWEIPIKNEMVFAFMGMVFTLALGGAFVFIKNNADLLAPWLFF
jgi:hypothetical protein